VRKEKSSQVAKKMVPFDKTRFFLISENLAHHRIAPALNKQKKIKRTNPLGALQSFECSAISRRSN
jgi:hypothetical protein